MKTTYGSTDELHQQALKLVGDRMRALRKSRGVSLVQLGAALEMDRVYLGLFERGMVNISIAALLRIGVELEAEWSEVIPDHKVLKKILDSAPKSRARR